ATDTPGSWQLATSSALNSSLCRRRRRRLDGSCESIVCTCPSSFAWTRMLLSPGAGFKSVIHETLTLVHKISSLICDTTVLRHRYADRWPSRAGMLHGYAKSCNDSHRSDLAGRRADGYARRARYGVRPRHQG